MLCRTSVVAPREVLLDRWFSFPVVWVEGNAKEQQENKTNTLFGNVAADFAFGLVKGLTSYLTSNEEKARLAKQLYLLCNESPLDANRPLDSFFDERAGRFQPYVFDSSSMEIAPEEVALFFLACFFVQSTLCTLLFTLPRG